MRVQPLKWSAVSQRELLEKLLPHRAPMILLEEVLSIEENRAISALQINENSAFYRPELCGVPAWVGLEYMAQTIAVWSGDKLLQEGKPIAIGFLLGSRSYQSETGLFKRGVRLITEVSVVYLETSGLSCFDCLIWTAREADHCRGEILATARIKAFRPENHNAFIMGKNTVKGDRA